jgi:hypothetical protein
VDNFGGYGNCTRCVIAANSIFMTVWTRVIAGAALLHICRLLIVVVLFSAQNELVALTEKR